MLECFDFHYLPAETRNFLEWRIKVSEFCGKVSGSPTRVFPRILGPGVSFAMAACGLLCFRSMPNSVLISHRYQQCLHSIKALSVTLLPQWRGWGCARCCEETQLGHHLACFAMTKAPASSLIWLFGPCASVVLSGVALCQSSLTHGTQLLSPNTQQLWRRALQRLSCGLTCWPLCQVWVTGMNFRLQQSFCES